MSSESQYIKDLKEAGWNPAVITILVQDGNYTSSSPATVEDAAMWHNLYQLEFDTLYDSEWVWADRSLVDRWSGFDMDGVVAFPWTLVVHTAHMRVWYLYGGFAGEPYYSDWLEQQLEFLDMCAKGAQIS